MQELLPWLACCFRATLLACPHHCVQNFSFLSIALTTFSCQNLGPGPAVPRNTNSRATPKWVETGSGVSRLFLPLSPELGLRTSALCHNACLGGRMEALSDLFPWPRPLTAPCLLNKWGLFSINRVLSFLYSRTFLNLMTNLQRQYFHSLLAKKDTERISGMAGSHSTQGKSQVKHPDHSLMLKLQTCLLSHHNAKG